MNKKELLVFIMKAMKLYKTLDAANKNMPLGIYDIAFCEEGEAVHYGEIPCDSRIAWLEPATQGAYIDTEIKPTLTTGIEIKVRCPANGVDNAKETIYFGASTNAAYASGNNYCLEKSTNKNITAVAYKTSASGTSAIYSTYAGLANPYIVVFNYNGNKQGVVYNENRTEVLKTTTNMTVSAVPTALNLFMFCRNINGTPDQSLNYITRIYYLKLWQGTTLVRHFLPVRLGNTGYMYDMVSKQLFGSANSNKFTCGPDI